MNKGAYMGAFSYGVIAMAEMEIRMDNLEDVLSGLDKRKEYVARAVNSTCKEFKSRAPGWISKAVTNEYTIKSGEVRGALTGKRSVGSITLGGITLEDVRLEYTGRVLTFSHFRYNPKKPPTLAKKKAMIPGQYTTSGRPVVWASVRRSKAITVEVHKGQKKKLSGKYATTPFITSMRGSPMMPFQRRSSERTDAVSLRSVSVPQMITNEKVAEDISNKINDGLAKRLEHHLQRYSNA